MEEDRKRYEQRLSLFMSNPETRYPDMSQPDLASKVEIQRLKQELAVAETTLSIVPSSSSEMVVANDRIKRELEETLEENKKMKEQGSFEFWRQRSKEAREDQERARKEMFEAFESRREEERMYLEEEREARKRGEDIERLRNERNEWKEQYDGLIAGWSEEEYEYEEEEEEARETRSETQASIMGYSTSKISRKEADKVIVPNWPRIHELEFWKSQVTANIVAASGDLDHDAWTTWIAPTFKISPDIDGILAGSGDTRFNSVDVKLASALMAMMQNGGEQAREVLNEARLKMAKGCRGGTPIILKGRQLLAMIVDSFRSASNTDLVFTIKHLYDLPYPGDNDIVVFKSQWNEVLECMRPADVPNDIALRDILYDKIKGSKLMAFDLHYYEGKEETHSEKTYKYLMDTISKHIRLRREEKNRNAKNQGLKHLTRYPSLPATTENENDKPAKAAATPKTKSPAVPPKAAPAGPVLADPKVKPHQKGSKGAKGKGKGKGKNRDRTRSPSVPRTAAEKKKIPCRFYFGSGTTCTRGRDCEYSHSKDSPRANSPANDRKSVCYAFLQGKCTKGKDCKYTHDKKALAVVKASVKAAAAKPKESPSNFPRGGDPKAAPSVKAKAKASAVALAVHSDDSDNESFCSDVSTVSAVGRGCMKQPSQQRKIRKDMKLKFRKKHDVIKFQVVSDQRWSKSFSRRRTGRRVSEKELLDSNRIDQIRYEELRSKVRGLALERSIENPKKGNARATINGTWKLDVTVNKDINSPNLFIEKFYRDENEDNEGNSDMANAYSTVKIGKKIKFIMDTGCGYDLISQRKAQELGLNVTEGNDRMVFMTANGVTETREVAKCTVDSFGEEAKPFVLEQTPGVFSVGMRCMKLGYTFVWPPGKQPFMINSSGKRIDLHSKDDIPYLIPGDGSEPHDEQLASDIHDLLNKRAVVTETPAVAGEEDGGEGGEPEIIGEDEDGVIEVDVHEGEQRMAKPGALKAEAKTISHLLTHRYRNPFCQSCVRAKMKHFRTHRGAFKRELKKWGDLITFDFADMEGTNYMGIPEDRELLIIRDRFTGVIQAFPLKGKTTEDIVLSIKRFIGNRKVTLAFSDQAPQFVRACRELKIPLDTSVPGRKVTNSLAERNIQFLVGATTTCLLEAGLPACYWTFAVTCVSHLLNIEDLDDGSAWQKMHKEKFKGPMIPLGAKVIFKPSDARWREQDTKFDPKGLYGVFAGYVIESGNKWSRRMLVWNLHDFKKVNLAFNCEKVPMSLQRPNVTERVELVLPITFPLKDEYERLNGTLEGMNTIDDRDGRPDIGDMIGDEDHGGEDDGDEYEPTEIGDEDYHDDGDDHPPPEGKSSSAKPDEKVIPPKRDILDEHPDHYSYGSAGDGFIYHDDDGNWVKLDKLGRMYRVDKKDGRRIVKTTRPKEFTPEEWKSLGHEHRKALAEEFKTAGIGEPDTEEEDAEPAPKRKSKKEKKTASAKKDDEKIDEPKGHPDDIAVSESLTPEHRMLDTVPSGSSGWQDGDSIVTIDENNNWVEWEEFVCTVDPALASVPLVQVTSSDDIAQNECNHKDSIPMMPCIHHLEDEHRTRLGESYGGGIFTNALVSRPVGRKEMLSDPEALESMMKEWKGQWTADVYDFKNVREYDDVVKEASRKGEEIHMARVHGICVEKHSELPKEDKRRKFKGRGVLLGNQVKNQNFEAALFQDLGNSPASFESSRWADMFGCLPGHNVQLADAIQAYIQASLTGVACWVELPDEAWPPWVNRKNFRRPVVRLIKALYGHPDAGTMWEKHCDQAVKKLGFVPIGPNWPSMHYYSKLNLLLVVYVDDLKLAGPEANLAKGWTMLRSLLNIEPETDLGMYLGCTLKKGENRLKDGTRVSTMTYDMESFLDQCVEKYKEIVGKDVVLKHVATPSLPEDPKQHPARAPCSKGAMNICPWCKCSFSGQGDKPSSEAAKGIKDTAGPDSEVRGELAPHAASVLMKLLYAARIARFDLLRSINNLARNVTKWSKKDDVRLHHLMCYVNGSKTKKMIGWVGDDLSQLTIDIYADADFAGCEESLRSTSGAHMVIQGRHTRFPVAGASKRQGCVSHSTPEAEIIAADFALRTMGVPVVDLWRIISGQEPKVIFHDDNQPMIAVIRSGKNPTMRHIERSHGISITWMHEMFLSSYIILIYEITSKMAADIHTKAFRDPMAWKRACLLINVLEDKDISGDEIWDVMQQTHDVTSGQRQKIIQSTGSIPTFQYTTTPVVPREVYTPGMTGKVGLQEIEGCDPIFIVKLPKQYRLAPPSLGLTSYLRSTWFLKHGKWQCVESRQQPHGSQPINEWVERALFQFHPLQNTVPAPNPQVDGQLILSLSPLLDLSTTTQHIHSLPIRPLQVINALTRIAHGGRGDKYSELSHDLEASDGSNYKGFRTKYEDGQPSRIALLSTTEIPEDYWEFGVKTVRRVHKMQRKQFYLPLDVYDCPVEPRHFRDTRSTCMITKNDDGSTSETLIHDSWRCLSDASDLRQENEWTGYIRNSKFRHNVSKIIAIKTSPRRCSH